jgi:hypothetical protein
MFLSRFSPPKLYFVAGVDFALCTQCQQFLYGSRNLMLCAAVLGFEVNVLTTDNRVIEVTRVCRHPLSTVLNGVTTMISDKVWLSPFESLRWCWSSR